MNFRWKTGRNCFWIARNRIVYGKGLKKGDGNLEGQVIENAVQETVQETVDKVSSNWDQIKAYFNGHIPDLISFGMKVVLSIVAFYVGTKLIKWLLKVAKRSMEKAGIDMGVAQFICSFGKFLLYLILIFNIATNFGVKESSVAALLGTAGVTIGLALQGGLENLSGGVMLLLFKPFQVGDYIIQDQAGGTEGTVYKVEMFYTTLITIDNKHVIIPNGKLSNSTIINVTAQNLQHILQEDPGTKSDKDMLVFVDELADSAVVMGLRVWVPTDKYWKIKWRLNEKIKESFDANGISIPYPQMDVHVVEANKDK